MKHMLKLCALATLVLLGLTGCTSYTEIKWGGKTALRHADGTVITSPQGEPYYDTAPNTYEDHNWLTKREERDVAVEARPDGSYTAKLGSRTNDVSENGIRMVTGSIEATTKLVSACAEAYVKIAGGGVATDVTTAVVSKVIQAFTSGGGDVGKATVTTTDNAIKVSDGAICTTCDPDGNCTTGTCAP